MWHPQAREIHSAYKDLFPLLQQFELDDGSKAVGSTLMQSIRTAMAKLAQLRDDPCNVKTLQRRLLPEELEGRKKMPATLHLIAIGHLVTAADYAKVLISMEDFTYMGYTTHFGIDLTRNDGGEGTSRRGRRGSEREIDDTGEGLTRNIRDRR